MTFPVIDHRLAVRLERAEGTANARFVDARAAVDPARGAEWRDIDGIWAMFDGVGSPLTQTFGLGIARPATAEALEAVEAFYRERGSPVDQEISPLALDDPLPLLVGRGYAPIELTDVMVRGIGPDDAASSGEGMPVDRIDRADADAWADAAADGWSETPAVVPFVRELGAVFPRTAGAHCFAARVDGIIAGAGVLCLHDGVALLGGASTRPAFRRRGAQTALFAARLSAAHAAGCDLAMVCARPGSDSHRNAERRGFRVAYTRIKWQRGAAPGPAR